MRYFVSLLFCAAVLTQSGWSATSPASSSGKTIFSPGLSVPILADSGETALGISLGLLFPAEPGSKLFVGGDVGVHFWGKFLSPTASTTALQLLPTAIYHLGSKPSFVPFIGLCAGPYWYVAQATGGPGIDFMILLRPGIQMALGDSMTLTAETKYGSVEGLFVFIPTLSVNIGI